MPPLLQSAQLKPDVTITSADDTSDIDESDDERFEFHYLFIFSFFMCKFHMLQVFYIL